MRDADVSHDVLRLAIEGLSDQAVLTLDPDGIITSWNIGAERLLGWSCEQALHEHVASVIGAGGTEAGIGAADLTRAMYRDGVTSTRRLQHRDGSARLARTTILAPRRGSTLLGYVVVARQPDTGSTGDAAAPARDLHEGTAEDMRRQLSESSTLLAVEVANRAQTETARARLLRRLVGAQEDERRRLARDLHDDLGQRLTALKLMLEGLAGSADSPAAQSTGITNALEMLAAIDRDVDFIAWELTPAALDDVGLVRALDAYVTEWSRHSGIAAAFHARPDHLPGFAAEVEVSVYRIAQEALNNVAKHAGARTVNVVLQLRNDTLVLIVEDDGVGFQQSAGGQTMIGLAGMRERAAAVGGSVDFEATPGGGATVMASIPATGHDRQRAPAAGENASSVDPVGSSDVREERASPNLPLLAALRRQLHELHRAMAARDEFIATVAHELRNPIAPLTFQVRLALTKTDQFAADGAPVPVDWIRTQLRGMERRLHRLLETLDRLLDVSRLSTGRIDLQFEAMSLAAVVREVIEAFDAELAAARCTVMLSERGSTTGVWDRLRVEQVCRNLLSNAIRFGAGRPIEVALDADDDVATLVVRDHGVGIAPDQQTRIFERFERGGEQRSGGFGVGLWIVRKICMAMAGSVTVESTLGEGARFTVSLPRRQARAAIEPASE